MLWSWTGKTKETKDSSDEDRQLVSRLKRRDENAFLTLYDRHRRSVYRFLMYMTGSTAVAEELTQEVFVVILEAMCTGAVSQFDPEKGTLEGYLLGIARNLARKERRHAGRLLSLDSLQETSEWDQLADKFSQGATEQMIARSELKVLYRAMLELPSHYREALVLCSLQEKSYQEAATILQCSEGTIASRMNRAKALLAAKLQRATRNEVDTTVT